MLGITIASECLANYINVEDLQANLRSIVELLSPTYFVVQSQQKRDVIVVYDLLRILTQSTNRSFEEFL